MKIVKNYNDINWKQCNTELARLQFKILEAFRNCDNNNYEDVLKAQYEFVQSLAVRKVTTNFGNKTPFINKVIYKTKKEKFEAIQVLKNLKQYKAQLVQKIYIPKPNGKLRLLVILTMFDRMMQTLYYFALDSIAEETVDEKSYGFRLYRGVTDNAIYLKLVLGMLRLLDGTF